MAGWAPLGELLETEIRQRAEEGCVADPAPWLERLQAADPADICALEGLYDELTALSPPVDLPYREPSDIETIHELRPNGVREMTSAPSGRNLFEKILGGWIGRCCGCSLGRPFRIDPFLRHPKNRQRHEIQRWLDGADAWPLDHYVPAQSRASVRGLRLAGLESTRESIKAMEPDENIDPMLLALETVETAGRDFSTADVALAWLDLLPLAHAGAAQAQALVNLFADPVFFLAKASRERLESIDWHRVATRRNPCREWSEGRARADVYGYLEPGRPERAAERAWRDARLTHDKNGLYAAMFTAALIGAAFCERDTFNLIDIALSEIPLHCRLSAAVRKTLTLCDKYIDWPDCWDETMAIARSYDALHAIPNLLAVVVALWYGQGDFEKSICIAASQGLDAAANAATVGSILGVLSGSRALPGKWVAPLQNTLKTHLPSLARTTISDGARRCFALLEEHKDRG
ncbi:ADP-ribosylglycohydrolase family protein [Candidatus Sumerlaeota bacterium]|nr:ADP-ribosylglycohydrolase family protein [Candidatus Sumerlaeota bacterium]